MTDTLNEVATVVGKSCDNRKTQHTIRIFAIIMRAFTDLTIPFNELSGVSFTYGHRVSGKFDGSDQNRATAVQWTWNDLNNSGLIGNLSSDAALLVANTHETPSMGDHFMIVQNPEVERIFMDGAARIRSIFPALKSNISSIRRTKFFKEFMNGIIVGSLKWAMAYLKEYIDFN